MGQKSNKKLNTGIKGLDDLFYGGLQLDQCIDNHDGLLILARGEHGVNKIHLAMQMCEGLYASQNENDSAAASDSYNPLSPIVYKNSSVDQRAIMKMLVKMDILKIIGEYAENKIKRGGGDKCEKNRWEKFFKKFIEDTSFTHICATKLLDLILDEDDNGLKNDGSGTYKNKDDIENAIKSKLYNTEDYGKTLLRLFVTAETITGSIKIVKDYVKIQVDKKGINKTDKKICKKVLLNNNDEAVRDFTWKCVMCAFNNDVGLMDNYWKEERKEVIWDALTNLFKGRKKALFIKELKDSFQKCSLIKKEEKSNEKLLFISLNKDGDSLKSKYYDFYIQRLIHNIRSENKVANSSVELLQRMLWYVDRSCCECDKEEQGYLAQYGFPSIKGDKPTEEQIQILTQHIRSGFIYYNGRTHGLHLRHQKGAKDTGDMLLCKLFVPKDSLVKIIGRDELNNGNRMADGLTSFNNLLTIIENYLPNNKEGNNVDFIMVDGLSRLTTEEIVRCPFNALTDKLRKACKIGVITADEKLKSSEISIDIIIDMAIKEGPDTGQLYHALRISKCLYQRNAYGWHSYKMRVAGIEVIPSIHFQMITRYLMDDVVSDALLPIEEDPYPYWLNETTLHEDEEIKNTGFFEFYAKKQPADFMQSKSALKGYLHYDKDSAMNLIINDLQSEKPNKHHYLIIDLDYNRTEFKQKYYNKLNEIISDDKDSKGIETIHLFSFQPGFLHTDEFMWAIDQQVQAISNKIKIEKTNNDVEITEPDTHYQDIHIIIGDLNYINFAYPCLNKEGLVLPAIAAYTKKHHMTNYVYASVSKECVKPLEKEVETCRQMLALIKPENMYCKAMRIE